MKEEKQTNPFLESITSTAQALEFFEERFEDFVQGVRSSGVRLNMSIRYDEQDANINKLRWMAGIYKNHLEVLELVIPHCEELFQKNKENK